MTNYSAGVPNYIRQLSMEATFQNNEDNDSYIYGYVTYDKTKLNGPRISKMKKYNIQASGRIPVTENEFLDMTLNTDKDNKILDFHMTYVRNFTDNDQTLLGNWKFQQPVRTLNIRTDIGPHRGSPHIDVEVFDTNNKKVVDKVVRQDVEFTDYESAISAVLMQVERISNPLIGAQYWLSPTQIFSERVKRLAKLREQYQILTPLSVLSRAINLRMYEETRSGIIIDETDFWNIAESQIQLIREKEKELGGYLDIAGIHYSTEMSALPFLFFAPESADYSFKAYSFDGSEIRSDLKLLGVVSEKKKGINFIRNLDSNERYVSNTAKKNSKIKDSFITELALVNEPISGWVKYDESLNFDTFCITYEGDNISKSK